MYKIGQQVYVKELNKIGIVTSVNQEGYPERVKIGDKIIKVVDYIITHVDVIVRVLQFFRSLFKKQI